MISANVDMKLRKAIYRRDGFRCALCDSTRYLQLHHAVPRGKGGPDTPQNLICLCADCHALAHGTDLRELGASPEDVEQAVVEYLSDIYAENGWAPWNPWAEGWPSNPWTGPLL